MLARTLGPEEGWIVMSHVGWGGEQNTPLKGVDLAEVPHRLEIA